MNKKEIMLMKKLTSYTNEYPNIWKKIKYLLHSLWLFPLTVWLLYFIGDNWWGIQTKITAGDLLAFYGAILAFIGTVGLGALALWQNKEISSLAKQANDYAQEANNLNFRLLSMEEAKFFPQFVCVWVGSGGYLSSLKIKLINCSTTVVSNVDLSTLMIQISSDDSKSISGKPRIIKNYIESREFTGIEFDNKGIENNDRPCKLFFDLSCNDVSGYFHNFRIISTEITATSSGTEFLQFTVVKLKEDSTNESN